MPEPPYLTGSPWKLASKPTSPKTCLSLTRLWKRFPAEPALTVVPWMALRETSLNTGQISECPYCGIQEPLQAQRNNPNLCIVVRHIPSDEYGESLKKALAYEALRGFSGNAAHRFWDAVLPKTSLGIPVPYEAALQAALQEAAIAPEAFADALQAVAPLVSADIVAAQSRIMSTPTWILDGIRFPACDFTAAELPTALELARKTRAGDADAQERVIGIITRGLLNEQLL